jgi:voltage-gated potassium channel
VGGLGTAAPPETPEAILERRFPGYRYGVVLALLFATFVVMASGTSGRWSQLVIVALQGATLFAALVASRSHRRTFHVMFVVVLSAFVGSLVSAIADTSNTRGSSFLLNALLVAIAPVIIGRALWRRAIVDVQTILGAICIYVLVGMLWSFVYQAMTALGSSQFFVQNSKPTSADDLYFSFVTLTTVGYGDLTPATSLGRSFAVLEALLGQIYLVTIVSVLVSRLGRSGRREVETQAG